MAQGVVDTIVSMLPEVTTEDVASLTNELEDMNVDVFKTKKKKKAKAAVQKENEPVPDDGYTYMFLLDRIYLQMPKRVEVRNKMPAPKVYKVGTKRTQIKNLRELCNSMNRLPEHFAQFVSIELESLASVGEGTLNIRGVLREDQVISLVKKYLKDFVACGQCESWNTILEHSERLSFIVCKDCNSRLTLAPMKKGYRAKTTFQKKVLM